MLEQTVEERTAELAHEKANLEISVAERTAQLNAANDELRNQGVELSKRNQCRWSKTNSIVCCAMYVIARNFPQPVTGNPWHYFTLCIKSPPYVL